MVPHSLLQKLFQSFEIDTHELAWVAIKKREIKQFLSLVQELPLEKQNQLEGLCYDVFELASSSGWDALCEMAEYYQEHDWYSLSPEKTTLYAKSLWTWLHYPNVFQKALEFHQVENASWWRKRKDLPQLIPDWNEDIRKSLEQALQHFFIEKQERGHVCTVEMQHYKTNVYYFIAYPDDHVKAVFHHNESGNLVLRKIRPTFEIIFAYNSAEGTLELHTKGGNKTKAALEEIFIKTILGEEVEICSEQVYDLSVFKRTGFTMLTDPNDCIRIQIRQVRISWGQGRSILFRADQEPDILAWIHRVINQELLPWEDAVIDYIKLQFLFLPMEFARKGSLTFELNIPNRSTLQEKNPRKTEIIRKYLKQWGIEYEQDIEKSVNAVSY
jgi:hypothetical protein